MEKRSQPSELTSAAEALDAELRKFEALSESIQKTPFNSEKNLGHASRTLTEIAQVGEALQARLGSVVAALANFRQKQQAHAEAVQKRAHELEERGKVLGGLLAEYGALGENVRELNVQLQSLKSPKDNGGAQFQNLEPRVNQLVEAAQKLFEQAETLGFTDIAHQAAALRQQLQAIRNKLNLLRQRLAQA
jgi:chromosome segregation ATPase